MCANITRRAGDMRAASAAMLSKTALFNIHVGGMARYRAQFARLTSAVVSAYPRAPQVIVAAPHMAMPQTLLQGSRELGFSHNPTPLEEVAAAARLKSTLQDAWAHYERVAASYDAILGALGADFWHLPWHRTHCISQGLRREYIQHSGYG